MLAGYRERLGVDITLLPPIGEDPRLGQALREIVSDSVEASHG